MKFIGIDEYSRKNVLAYVLVGGEGRRLFPLTSQDSKPSLVFGLDNRIVDFVISNLINSNITQIYLIAQYKPKSLSAHVYMKWRKVVERKNGFIKILYPKGMDVKDRFTGTADAIFKNLELVAQHRPELVAIFSADHVYRMDVRNMIRYHLEKNADVTISSISLPFSRASSLGVLSIDTDSRISEFNEKPKIPSPIPTQPGWASTSMGNYIFRSDVLMRVAEQARENGDIDFGHDVMKWLINDRAVYAYDFGKNKIPGIKNHELSSYWYDVGTFEAYWQAHQDLLGSKPKIELNNPEWPIGRIERSGGRGHINSLVSHDFQSDQSIVINSVIRGRVVVGNNVVIEDSLILGDAVIKDGARIRHAIIDQYNVIEKNARIGYDRSADMQRYHLDLSGLVVIPRGELKNTVDEQQNNLRKLIAPVGRDAYPSNAIF